MFFLLLLDNKINTNLIIRSKALRRLIIAINVTLLLLLANVIAVFAATEYMISTFDNSIDDLNAASLAKRLVHEGALYLQILYLSYFTLICEDLHKR